jgi:membrane protein DedA with SNARE-associated domain
MIPSMPASLFRVMNLLGYLGWIGITIGLIVFLFGDKARGTDLMLGGAGAIAAKYIGTLILVLLVGRQGRRP